MREASPKKLAHSPTAGGFQSEAKSLFRKILALNPYGSRFCPYLSIPNRAKFIETNILAEGYQKKLRYRFGRRESFRPRRTFRRPSGAHFQSWRTSPGAGSAGLLSSAPTGLAKNSGSGPTALRPFDKLRAGCGLYSFAALRLLPRALGSIFCDQSAVEMRSRARLPSAEFTLLSRSGPAGRTSDDEYLFGDEFSSHIILISSKTKTSQRHKSDSLTSAGTPGKSVSPRGLPFRDNGHGPTLQKGIDQCAIYFQAAVVLDEAFLLKRTHKFTYPGAGGTNHLC
jgi:hypothetical protein